MTDSVLWCSNCGSSVAEQFKHEHTSVVEYPDGSGQAEYIRRNNL